MLELHQVGGKTRGHGLFGLPECGQIDDGEHLELSCYTLALFLFCNALSQANSNVAVQTFSIQRVKAL